jgi:hypothetical protein
MASQEILGFYGTRRFITMLKDPATSPYPVPDEFRQHPHILFV